MPVKVFENVDPIHVIKDIWNILHSDIHENVNQHK